MEVITYEAVNPSLIPNTIMRKLLRDGVHTVYYIAPVPGYVLHDNAGNWEDAGITYEAYYMGECSCRADYDFVANPREFYAVMADSVPADQIFGGGDTTPDREITAEEAEKRMNEFAIAQTGAPDADCI